MMESSIIQRISDVIRKENISPKKFSELIGFNYSTLNNYLSGRRSSIDVDLLVKISSSFENVSTDWLITGRGDMFRGENNINPIKNNEFIGSPYYNVDFIGGFDAIYNSQTINPDYYIDFAPYNENGVVWCNITGKSMEPEINSGDIIAMKELTTNIEYLPLGEIYGFVTNEYRTVKKLGRSDKDGYIRLIPTNKSEEFSSQDIPAKMVLKVFSVLGSVKRF